MLGGCGAGDAVGEPVAEAMPDAPGYGVVSPEQAARLVDAGVTVIDGNRSARAVAIMADLGIDRVWDLGVVGDVGGVLTVVR